MSASNRFRTGWDALQSTLRQSVETVTRTARIDVSSTGVDEIDPPDDLDEYWNQYKTTGIVRSNFDQFVSDVVKPGVRIEADDDTTVDYFMGGDSAPDEAPDGGFLSNSFVHAGERHQPFQPGLKSTIANRWIRGTVTVELLKKDKDDAESEITGFYHIRPETLYPQVYANKNILLDPDPDASANENVDFEETPRGEVAAYLQFDDQSILGRRIGGFSQDAIPLSQNDVMKQVLSPDIGGDDTNEQGIFGTSVLEAISVDIEEYKATKRDRYRAIQTKAYGIWLANFGKEAIELSDTQREIVEWDDKSQQEFMDVVEGLGPGDVMEADGPLEMKQFDSDVPDLESTLGHYVDDITSPLPAPKYSIGFEKNINQFVTERQETRYDDIVDEERRYQERKWTGVFRTIAERHDALDPSGLEVVIEPEEDESPVRSLDDEEIERIRVYTQALKDLYGSGSAASFVDEEMLRELVLQLPEDSEPEEPETPPEQGLTGEPPPGEQGEQQPPGEQPPEQDEEMEQIEAQFRALMNGDG